MPPAQLVMYPAMAVTRQPPHAKIVPSIMNLQEVDRPAPFAHQEHSLLKEIPLVHPVIPLAPLVSRLQPHASPATSTMSPPAQGRPARPASWALSPRSGILRVHPATSRVMVAMRLPLRVKTVL